MKKYLSLVLIFIVSLLALGCGEQTFDDIIYTDITGLQEVATVAETYNVSKTNTMELNVVYNTTLTLTIDNVTYTREIKTTIGELARKGIFQTEIVCKKGDEIERTICQTCYDGDIYTMFKYEDGNVQKSHDTYSTVTYSNANMIKMLLPTLDESMIENYYYKTFEDISYYKHSLIWKPVNDNFKQLEGEASIIQEIDKSLYFNSSTVAGSKVFNPFGYAAVDFCKTTNYVKDYYIEYGINQRNYISMFRKEFTLITDTNPYYAKFKATSFLTTYGLDVKDIQLPADLESYFPPVDPGV